MMQSIASLWEKARSWLMLGIGCALSPCCTPLIVPIVIMLLVGTPAALWMTTHLGWVYGGLTVISVVSFVLGFRWMGKRQLQERRAATQQNIGILMRDLTSAKPQQD